MQPLRVAIVGASSLLGKDLKEVIEAGALAHAEIRLLDEENLAGTLAEAGGEPVVIQTVSEESFEHVRLAFFASAPDFARAHCREAQRAGASVIDLSGGLADLPGAARWIPSLDLLLPRAAKPTAATVYVAPSAPVIVACAAVAALAPFGVERVAIVFLLPVSEQGQAGIEELENQTVKLLSFQPIAQEVFDAQVAFNLLDRHGEKYKDRVANARATIAAGVRKYLGERMPAPAIQLVQAPVFHSTAFSIYAELRAALEPQAIAKAVAGVGMRVTPPEEAASNVGVAGESHAVIGSIARDPNVERGWWVWGVADNLRLPASNAVQIAEKLIAS